MKNKHINDFFEDITPTAEKKDQLYREILRRRSERAYGDGEIAKDKFCKLARILRPAFAGVLCILLFLGVFTLYPKTPAFAVYAFGVEAEITDKPVEITSGTISDSGEMMGHLLQLYVKGKKIDNVKFSCKNQYLEFNDWTEQQAFVGKAKSIVVDYKEMASAEYYYLRIDWIPWDALYLLSENKVSGIADLPVEMRNDQISIEVLFSDGTSVKLAVQVALQVGAVSASLTDDTVVENNSVNEKSNEESAVPAPESSELEVNADGSRDSDLGLVISPENEAAARDAAFAYYNNTIAFANRVKSMTLITDSEFYVGLYSDEGGHKNVTVAFEVVMSESNNPPMHIVLTKEGAGEWTVMNVGY